MSTASLPVETENDSAMSCACRAARSTVAMAPRHCESTATQRRPATGTGVQALKVSGMPST